LNHVRVVLADDHQMILERLTRILETEFEVIGVAGDGLLLIATVNSF
jgi:DNA-binding NarL/FixJ family response regulator